MEFLATGFFVLIAMLALAAGVEGFFKALEE